MACGEIFLFVNGFKSHRRRNFDVDGTSFCAYDGRRPARDEREQSHTESLGLIWFRTHQGNLD